MQARARPCGRAPVKRLAVLSRWPEPGRVKTRLSPALPAALACDLHRAMLDDALTAAAGAAADQRILYWDGAPDVAFDAATTGFAFRRQRGADLGERLANAFDEMLGAGAGPAIAIGADCPALDAKTLDGAFEALDRHDLVLGPAVDGGYYLIGLARPAAALFGDIAWGSERVYAQTLERARAQGLSIQSLEARADIDTPEDLIRWIRASVGAPPTAGAFTTAALRAMGLVP